jgi:hypothetical protein
VKGLLSTFDFSILGIKDIQSQCTNMNASNDS